MSGTTSHYEVLRVVLGGTMRYHKLYCKSLCDITRGLRYKKWFFRGILPNIIFQKNCYEIFLQNSQKTDCDRVLALVKSQPHADNFTKKGLHHWCFPMILNNSELWGIAKRHGKNWTLNSEAYSKPCQISKMELYLKIVKSFYMLTIFSKCYILDVWQGSEYISGMFLRVTDGTL